MHVQSRVERRLIYLWTFELLGAALWSLLVWLYWNRVGVSLPTAISLGLVIMLLGQGSIYWYAKLQEIRRRPLISKRALVRLFTYFRVANQVILTATGVGGLVWVFLLSDSFGHQAVVAFGLWTLAVLEYVNYFHWQLMYDSPSELQWLHRNRRLKLAQLARELSAGRL